MTDRGWGSHRSLQPTTTERHETAAMMATAASLILERYPEDAEWRAADPELKAAVRDKSQAVFGETVSYPLLVYMYAGDGITGNDVTFPAAQVLLKAMAWIEDDLARLRAVGAAKKTPPSPEREQILAEAVAHVLAEEADAEAERTERAERRQRREKLGSEAGKANAGPPRVRYLDPARRGRTSGLVDQPAAAAVGAPATAGGDVNPLAAIDTVIAVLETTLTRTVRRLESAREIKAEWAAIEPAGLDAAATAPQ